MCVLLYFLAKWPQNKHEKNTNVYSDQNKEYTKKYSMIVIMNDGIFIDLFIHRVCFRWEIIQPEISINIHVK